MDTNYCVALIRKPIVFVAKRTFMCHVFSIVDSVFKPLRHSIEKNTSTDV